jgi:ribose transport system substrate-binding protein
MKLSRLVLLSAALILVISSGGCGRVESGTATSAGKTKTYAMSLYVVGLPFWNDTKATWDAIGRQPGVKTIYSGPVDGDPQKQIQDIDTMIARKVDGIVVSASDSAALVLEINKAVDSGIPVVTYLNDAPNSKRMTNITSELEASSLKVGGAALENNTEPATAIISCADAGNQEQTARRHGFEMLAQQNPQLKIVGVVEDKFDDATGAQRIKPLLAKYRKLNYIFGCNSRSAVGAVSALKETGAKPGQVVVTGWDEDADELNLIEQGWVKYSVAQNSALMTQIAFAILQASAQGTLYPSNRQFQQYGISPVPDRIMIPVSLISSANVKGYYPKP